MKPHTRFSYFFKSRMAKHGLYRPGMDSAKLIAQAVLQCERAKIMAQRESLAIVSRFRDMEGE